MAVIAITANQVITLLAATLAYLSPDAVAAIREHGAYGASVLLYTLATAVQNNGCAYSMAISHEGLLQLSMVLMALGRFFVIAPPIIMAGEFLKQKDNPPAAVVIGPCWPLTVGFWVVLVVMGSVLAFMPLMFLTAVGEALP